MNKQHFIVRLHNGALGFQLLSPVTGLKRIGRNKPCCVAANEVVLGTNAACKRFNITVGEPLNKALLKCADLCTEAPDFDTMRECSAQFLEICSRFGSVTRMYFDECIISIDGDSSFDRAAYINAVSEAIFDELKIESQISLCDDLGGDVNPYSHTAKWSENALKTLSRMLWFKLTVDGVSARMFSVRITDRNGAHKVLDRRVDIACSDCEMILIILKTMLDGIDGIDSVTVNLFDISVSFDASVTDERKKCVKERFRKKTPWDYVKENKVILEAINKNKLHDFDNLCGFIRNNPVDFSFEQLCAVAEKATTRCLKLGGYYMPLSCAERFVSSTKAFSYNTRVIIDGYCPLSLLFAIGNCNAQISSVAADDRTAELLKLLEPYSPYAAPEIKPADGGEYDVSLSLGTDIRCTAKTNVQIVKKSFFASDERFRFQNKAIVKIIDFGIKGFVGSAEQYAALVIDNDAEPDTTEVISFGYDYTLQQKQAYITDAALPAWIIYRNEQFDSVYSKLQFNLFNVFSATQLKPRDYKPNGDICVISASCIDSGGEVVLDDSCRHVTSSDISGYAVADYVERDDIFFAAANSSVLKVARKPKGCIPNPTTVLLVPKDNVSITVKDLKYFASEEFRSFYNTALNHQEFVLSTDRLSRYFLGKVAN